MTGPRVLPDDQLAVIAWADDSVSTVALADALGLPDYRVAATRRRFTFGVAVGRTGRG